MNGFDGADARLERPVRLMARAARAEKAAAIVPGWVARRLGAGWRGYGEAVELAAGGPACLLVELGELHTLPEPVLRSFARTAVPVMAEDSYVLFYRGKRRLPPAPGAARALRGLAWFLAQLRAHDENGGLYRSRATGVAYRCRRSASDIGAVEEAWKAYSPGLPRLRTGAVVVDVGAHIGGFSVPLARLHPTARLLCFEPDPESFALLQENLRRNGIARAEAVPAAVAARAGRRPLYPCPESPVRSSLFRSEGRGAAVRVDCVSLPGIAARRGLARVDLLKIDAEGAEHDILLPHARFLRERVDRIIVEAHPRGRRDAGTLSGFLRAAGFAVRRRGGSRQAVLFARRRA